MKLHFQVVLMDSTGYILDYHNFEWHEENVMLEYIKSNSTQERVRKIEITRWNKFGNRE